MTIRERIADWISGGALTKAMIRSISWRRNADHWADQHDNAMDALRQITALETPKANATVRKMARIAREALA